MIARCLRRGKLISCAGWPDSCQESNAFKLHCRDTITSWNRGKFSPGAKGHGRDNAITTEERRGL